MQCPSCSLYHPARYQSCVSCGTKLVADGELVPPAPAVGTQRSRGIQSNTKAEVDEKEPEQKTPRSPRPPRKGGLPTGVGVAIAGFILCTFAGGTFFFLTKPPENERLFQDGQHQLQLGQFAFALKTLNEAVAVKPDDPRALLALARAYVGVDQVDKAWACIVKAQQLGAGVVSEPQLASDLANYYRQHGQFQRAVELLRPLATSNIAKKKSELADLDAAWGDQCLHEGNIKQALICWEEVKELHDGSRLDEADARLSTIYSKMGEEMSRDGKVEEALKYYARLNALSPSATSYERTADLYQKQNKLELAIDQMRQATKLTSDSGLLNQKLALLMSLRGKELLDAGEADAGYGYLQQAQSLDPKTKAPRATIRGVHVSVDDSGSAHFSGEVWNPGPDPLGHLVVKVELYDSSVGKAVAIKEQHVIDEFVPPLPSRESKNFDITPNVTVADAKTSELKVYLNGTFYRSYPLGKSESTGDATASAPRLKPRITPIEPVTAPTPQPAPDAATTAKDDTPPVAPNPVPVVPTTSTGSEEKTLNDLD